MNEPGIGVPGIAEGPDVSFDPCAATDEQAHAAWYLQVLDQQAQDLEDTMQQMVQKDRELHEQQAIADQLRRQFASDSANQTPELGGEAARAEGLVQACKEEYAQLQMQADRKAKMVRYLSDQVQERSEDVREAQQLLTTDVGKNSAARTVKERAARYFPGPKCAGHCIHLMVSSQPRP